MVLLIVLCVEFITIYFNLENYLVKKIKISMQKKKNTKKHILA